MLLKNIFCLLLLIFFIFNNTANAQENIDKEKKEEDKTVELDKITVKSKKKEKPSKKVISVDDYIPSGDAQNIMEYVKDQAIIDYRGKSDLVPDDDEYFMRGFGSSRFTTAIDGMTFRKTGGRQSSHIVDYALLPYWLVKKIEVIPGPHSALYPGKSIGGIINFITRVPRVRDTPVPKAGLSASYRSYNTQNYNFNVNGNLSSFIYDIGYQAYSTDGYLRHSESDIDTVFGRAGYVFDNGGYITLSASHTTADRNMPVENYADVNTASPLATYDPDYPTLQTTGRNTRYDWQDPSWDKVANSYRLNMNIPTFIGTLSGSGYWNHEERNKKSKDYDSGTGIITDTENETKWWSQGGRIQDEIAFFKVHKTTVAFDFEQLYDGDDKDKRVEIFGGALQHEWNIFKPLTLTAGVRYEKVNVNVSNTSSNGEYITGKGEWIEREWSGVMPKSFITYEMEHIAAIFRDTSVSAGVSRVWHAPDYHGDYNPQGKPSGAWLDPEQGMGYDFILARRLFGGFHLKAGYSFLDIRDYMAHNSSHAEYTPSGSNPVTPGLEYMDYMINLDKMHRHGIELDLHGTLIKTLYAYVSYSYQNYINRGDEPAGEEEASDKAKHRLNAGVKYTFFKKFVFLVDYSYQSKQVAVYAEEDDDEPGVYIYEKNPMDAYQLVNIGVSYKFIDKALGLKNAAFKVFVNNVFNEEYESARGYPMTDRTYGCSLKANI